MRNAAPPLLATDLSETPERDLSKFLGSTVLTTSSTYTNLARSGMPMDLDRRTELSMFKRTIVRASSPALLLCLACGNSPAPANPIVNPGPQDSGSLEDSGSWSNTNPDSGNVGNVDVDGGITTGAMPLMSRGVPAFASMSSAGTPPANANDDNPASNWDAKPPAWLAYDLSSAPADQRQTALVAWYSRRSAGYFNEPVTASSAIALDYTIEVNSAPGGGQPPPSGWTQVAAVTGNTNSAGQHVVELGGANWVRVNVTRSSDPNVVGMDLDVYSAPSGPTDDWLFMGDSITFISLMRAFCDLPKLVTAAAPTHVPAVIDAARGGTNTGTATGTIDATMTGYPGRYVVLAYGTNDHPNGFVMEKLVQKVIAAGKIPVVPHMPWASQASIQSEGPVINAAIDALYAKYPQILRGPDLWTFFTNRTDLIPAGDIHPNAMGQVELRKQWALTMAGTYR